MAVAEVFGPFGLLPGVDRCRPSPAAQTSSQSGRSIGVVVAIDATVKRITLKTDAGPEIGIEFQDTTRFLRVAPGSQDLSGATRITLSDVSAGDRILVRGRSGSEANSFVADTIIVMSKADLAKKQEAERADWERRGIGGVITALDPASREVTIRVGDLKSSKCRSAGVAFGGEAPALLARFHPLQRRSCQPLGGLEDRGSGESARNP